MSELILRENVLYAYKLQSRRSPRYINRNMFSVYCKMRLIESEGIGILIMIGFDDRTRIQKEVCRLFFKCTRSVILSHN